MQVTADTFAIRLTPAEFLFATSIAGFQKLYLFDSLASVAATPQEGIGQKSLEARGLYFRKSRDEMVMDSTLYAILRWALIPSWAVQFVIDTLHQTTRVTVFSQSGLMLVREVDGYLEFQMDREENRLKERAFSYAGIHSQEEPTQLPDQDEIECTCQINFYRYVNSCPNIQGRKTIVGNSKSLWLLQTTPPEVHKFLPVSAKSIIDMGVL